MKAREYVDFGVERKMSFLAYSWWHFGEKLLEIRRQVIGIHEAEHFFTDIQSDTFFCLVERTRAVICGRCVLVRAR